MTSTVQPGDEVVLFFGEQFEIIASRDKLHHMVLVTGKNIQNKFLITITTDLTFP